MVCGFSLPFSCGEHELDSCGIAFLSGEVGELVSSTSDARRRSRDPAADAFCFCYNQRTMSMPNARQLTVLAAALCAIRNGETSSETLRDLAQAFGATHPKAGTLRAIQAVLDQIENPSDFTRDQDAYEKHGATKATFCRWKQKLTQQSRSVAVDELSQSLGDGDED